MPPRRKQPARRASLRSQRYSPSPPEPVIEAMETNGSGEDMDVSEEEAVGFSSDVNGGPGSDAFGSENDQDDEIDVEDNQQEGLGEDDEEDQRDELSSSESPPPPPKATKAKSSPSKPRLKIKLKFSGVPPPNATPTPSDEMPIRPGRKGHPKHADVESEESEDEESSTPSYAGPTRMTQRQAALAGMVDSSEHLMLEETVSKRKKHLNETELALKREETARKRKNLTAKKLEDEKIETINRLLKKQTRPRGKRGSAAAADADEDGEQEGEEAATPALPPPPPTLFRWISSIKSDKHALSFSIPPSFTQELGGPQNTEVINPPPPKSTPICDVAGCTRPRKYKLVKDPSRGGCGMEHLKTLQVA